MGNGFGDANNIGVVEMHSFGDYLYAGTKRKSASGAAQLWRSSNGETWTRVSGSFTPTTGAILFMESFDSTLYFTTVDGGSSGGGVFKSTTGTSWTRINGQGTGWQAAGNSAATRPFVFENYLYAGTTNDAGAQLWRTPVGNTSWSKALDFASMSVKPRILTWLASWNGQLWASTARGQEGSGMAYLYASDAGDSGTWTKQTWPGESDANNNGIATMLVIGGHLYVTTNNRVTGGELWRTADGSNWTQIFTDGFGDAKNVELHALRALNTQLWLTTWAEDPNAAEVWRSDDGTEFVQSNLDGFGSSTNRQGTPIVAGFKGKVYWAGQNEQTGAQVWRLEELGA